MPFNPISLVALLAKAVGSVVGIGAETAAATTAATTGTAAATTAATTAATVIPSAADLITGTITPTIADLSSSFIPPISAEAALYSPVAGGVGLDIIPPVVEPTNWTPYLMMGGSSLMEGYGSYQQNKANEEIANSQAQQAKMNAAYNAKRQREINARIVSAQSAQLGASGVASTSGTPLQLLADQAVQGAFDEEAIRLEGEQAYQGYRAEGRGYRRAATANLMSGLLTSAGYGYYGYKKMKNPYLY